MKCTILVRGIFEPLSEQRSKGGDMLYARLIEPGASSSVSFGGTCYDGWFPDWTCISNGYNPYDGYGLCDRYGITTH